MSRASEARTVLDRGRRDPVWWFRHVLGVEQLTPQQVAVIESVRDNRRTAVPAGHAVGKTWLAARLALWFLYNWKGSKVVTTAPTWTQVERLLWRELAAAHSRAAYPLGGTPTKTTLDLGDDWYAIGLSTNDPTRFQGIHGERVMVIFDEATGVDQGIWEASEGIAVGEQDRFLAIGNPTDPTSRFKAATDSGIWNTIRLSSVDHPNVIENRVVIPGAVTREWVDEHRTLYGGEDTSLFRARVAGLWPEQGDDMLISLAWVERAQQRWREETAGAVEAVGCDVARFGSDETVIIAIHENGHVGQPQSFRGQDTMQTAGRLNVMRCAKLGVDDAGLGGGVTDRLNELGVSVTPVNAGSGASDSRQFVNRRAEMYWMVREMLKAGDLSLPDHAMMAADLTNTKYTFDSRGRIKIEAKDDIRERIARSPDYGDALAIACWAWKSGGPAIGVLEAETLFGDGAAEVWQ